MNRVAPRRRHQENESPLRPAVTLLRRSAGRNAYAPVHWQSLWFRVDCWRALQAPAGSREGL